MNATGVIVNGQAELVPGLVVVNFRDDPSLRLRIPGDGTRRQTAWIRAVCLHTTRGAWPQPILDGIGRAGDAAEANVRYWSRSGSSAGAHLVVDLDGTVVCTADLALEATYHATSVNDVSIGIEIVQRSDGALFAGQLDRVVRLVDWITARFGIARQIPAAWHGPVRRLEAGGRDVVGVYGHRDQTVQKGRGDPGDAVFEKLAAAGYERFDLARGADLAAWKVRQVELGMAPTDCDGVPGPKTVAALHAIGKCRGV